MIWWIYRKIGLRRIRHGYCPLCKSSPPNEDCMVCLGSYDYGPKISSERKRVLTIQFDRWLEKESRR